MAPLSVSEERYGAALSKGGETLTGVSQQLVGANPSRKVIEICTDDNPIYLDFTDDDNAVIGEGTKQPPNSTAFWPTTANVHVIGTAGDVVTFTEW